MVAARRDWSLLEYFCLRQAGFPLDWLQTLVCESGSALADAVIAQELDVRAARDHALSALRIARRRAGSETQQSLRELESALRKGRFVGREMLAGIRECQAELARAIEDSIAVEERLTELTQAFHQNYAEYLHKTQLLVVELFRANPQLRHALFLSNEASFDVFDAWLQSEQAMNGHRSHDRRKLDTLVMYLQRFCGKNETNSHFGPLSPGRIVSTSSGVDWDADGSLRRETFFTHWAAEALAHAMSQDDSLRSKIKLRRTPGACVAGSSLQVIRFEFGPRWEWHVQPEQPIVPEDAELLAACDGERTYDEVLEHWLSHHAEERAEAAHDRLRSLVSRGALNSEFEVPAGSPRPLDELADMLNGAAAPSSSTEALESLSQNLRTFGGVEDLEQRRELLQRMKAEFARRTGASAERGHGQHYADRAIVYEDCSRELPGLRIGGALYEAITRELPIYLDLLFLAVRSRFVGEQELLQHWFRTRFGSGADVSIRDFLFAFEVDRGTLEAGFRTLDERERAIQRDTQRTLLDGWDEDQPQVTVTLERVAALLERHFRRAPAVCNPDVMVVAQDRQAIAQGDFLLVVGDCHATRELLSHGGASPFMHSVFPDLGGAVIAQYENIIDADERLVDIIRDHPDKGAVQIPLPCFDLEVLGRSAKHRRDVISLDTLHVRDVGASLRLCSAQLGTHVRLIAPPAGGASARTDPLVIFSFPRFFARPPILGTGRPYLPRVVLGRVVIQRRTWQIPASDCLAAESTNVAAFLHFRRLRRRLGLPRWIFAKVDGEAKPLLVDSEAPLLVRQFVRQVRRCSGLVTLSEMLPGPDGLWLDGQQGGRVCSEFRLAMFDDGTGA